MDILLALIGTAAGIFMTLALAGAVYEHRAALPMVGLMFFALILFGLMW